MTTQSTPADKDTALRERIRPMLCGDCAHRVDGGLNGIVELVRSELSRAGGERAGIGAAAWVEGYAELKNEVVKFGTAHLYTKESALIPAARLIRELSQERDEARRQLAAVESARSDLQIKLEAWYSTEEDLRQTITNLLESQSTALASSCKQVQDAHALGFNDGRNAAIKEHEAARAGDAELEALREFEKAVREAGTGNDPMISQALAALDRKRGVQPEKRREPGPCGPPKAGVPR